MRKYKLQLICTYRHDLFNLTFSIPVVLSKQGSQHTHPCKEELYVGSHALRLLLQGFPPHPQD